MFNLRAGFYGVTVAGGALDVALWSKNTFDEEYSVNNLYNLPHAGRSVMFGEPRSYGLDLIYSSGY